jgi:methylaspartate ammonia-lyase
VLADSIFRRATRLLNYQVEDGVIGEVLSAYRSFIDQYVARAADLVKKYRTAQAFLDTTETEKLARSIVKIKTEVKDGNTSLQATLDEKQGTLEELAAMQEAQSASIRLLEKIDATLESLETAAVSAQTNNSSAKDVLDELQRTLSSTALAIKETLCNHSG